MLAWVGSSSPAGFPANGHRHIFPSDVLSRALLGIDTGRNHIPERDTPNGLTLIQENSDMTNDNHAALAQAYNLAGLFVVNDKQAFVEQLKQIDHEHSGYVMVGLVSILTGSIPPHDRAAAADFLFDNVRQLTNSPQS